MFYPTFYDIFVFVAYFDIDTLKLLWSSPWAPIPHITQRTIFSLWANCVHDLDVKTQTLKSSSYLNISPRHGNVLRYVFELTFQQTRTVTILASHMTKNRCVREEIYV